MSIIILLSVVIFLEISFWVLAGILILKREEK